MKNLPSVKAGEVLSPNKWNELIHKLNAIELKIPTKVNGNTGIGIATPKAPLHVAGGTMIAGVTIGHKTKDISYPWAYETVGVTQANYNLRLQSPNNVIVHTNIDRTDGNNHKKAVMILNKQGNVGIGTIAPTTKLQINGNRIRLVNPKVPANYIDIRADGTALDIETSKNLYLNNNGNKVLYRKMEKVSSRKYKKAIESLNAINAHQLLTQLKPVKYIYKTDPEQKLQLGFIAEEIPDEIAAKDKASIDPMDIITILCKVVQDHQKTINQLITLKNNNS